MRPQTPSRSAARWRRCSPGRIRDNGAPSPRKAGRGNTRSGGGMRMAKVANGRVALITGGASGIGLATAKRLLEAGWKVALADRDEKLLADVARELGAPKRVFTSALDVTDEAAAEKVVAMSAEALGGLDGV